MVVINAYIFKDWKRTRPCINMLLHVQEGEGSSFQTVREQISNLSDLFSSKFYMKTYMTPRDASRTLGISIVHLRRMEKAGEIDTIRSPKGHRRYDVAGYISKQSGKTLTTIGYCRVNQKTEADNLRAQIAFVQSHYPDAEIISDVGNGINFKRKGLNALLERVLQGDKLRVVVAHKDRLARFGGEVIEFLVEQNGGEVVVLDDKSHSREEELRDDLLSVLNVFSRRMHGLRKHRDKIREDRQLTKSQIGSETA